MRSIHPVQSLINKVENHGTLVLPLLVVAHAFKAERMRSFFVEEFGTTAVFLYFSLHFTSFPWRSSFFDEIDGSDSDEYNFYCL
jgi:hypothetical protein